MKIVAESLAVSNYKGIESLSFTFSEGSNDIFGKNGSKKSSVVNSMLWCLFGKDIENRDNYEIMPLDASNKVIDHMEPTVELTLNIDGAKKVFKRIMVQTWKKKHGDEFSSFDGSCTTKLFVDDIPMKAKEYSAVVDSIISTDLFRVLTIPTHFQSIAWKEKRKMVKEITGEEDYAKILDQEKFSEVKADMNGASIADYRKKLTYQKKEIKALLDKIPSQIDANQDFIPEVEEDYDAIRSLIKAEKGKIDDANKSVEKLKKASEQSSEKATKDAEKRAQIESDMSKLITEGIADATKGNNVTLDKIAELENANTTTIRINSGLKSQLENSKIELYSVNKTLAENVKKRAANKDQYLKLKESSVSIPKDTICPACKTVLALTEEEYNEKVENANKEIAELMENVISSNKPLMDWCANAEEKVIPNLNTKIELGEVSIKENNDIISDRERTIATLRLALVDIDAAEITNKVKKSSEYKDLLVKLEGFNTISDNTPSVDTSKETEVINAAVAEVERLTALLGAESIVKKAKNTIKNLRIEGKNMAAQITHIEKMEYNVDLLEKEMAEDMEHKINSLLSSGVSFRLFKKNINGSLEQSCDILINGVPYNSANTASRINAGLAIIDVFSKHYDIFAPVFIDNRESVTEIVSLENQTISLSVDPTVEIIKIK